MRTAVLLLVSAGAALTARGQPEVEAVTLRGRSFRDGATREPLGVGVTVPEAGGQIVRPPASTATTRRRLQARTADACAGCSCTAVAEDVDACAATTATCATTVVSTCAAASANQAACEAAGACTFTPGDDAASPATVDTCSTTVVSACAEAAADPAACAAAGACTFTTAQSACESEAGRCVFNQGTGPTCTTIDATVTPESTCTTEAANGAAACAGAGSCLYDDGTSDDVCEPADLATCTARSADGETVCTSAGACTFIANEDHRITERTDGSEWNTDLATKLAVSSGTHPNGLPMAPSSTCNDGMASNNGSPNPCTYDCLDLEEAYFPGTVQTVRCFVYDRVTGWPADLLGRIQTTKLWDPHDPSSTMTVADNTIYVPASESWIIQGVSDTGALPPVLPARLASGSRDEISRANIILRSFRITGQTAPLDAKDSWYTFSNANIGNDPAMRNGGAVSYEGHGSRLLFERMVIDHNVGTSGGGIFIYGHFQRNPNLLVTQVDMVDCLFWANQGRWVGGDGRLVDIWPLEWTMDGCHFLDSWCFIVPTMSLSQYANQMDAGMDGGPVLGPSAAPTLTGPSNVVMRNCLQDGTDGNSHDALIPGWRGFIVNLPAWATGGWQRVATGSNTPIMHVLLENVVTQNYDNEYFGGVAVHNYMQGAAGMQFKCTVVHCDFFDNKNHATDNQHTQGGITAFLDWLEVANSRFERGGFVSDAQIAGQGGAILAESHQMVSIRHSSFIRNWAAIGGAVAVAGSTAAEFHSCTFIDNKGSFSGGAIDYKAAGIMSVQDSLFLRNVVHTTTPPLQDKTVRLYTASSGPENPGEHSPEGEGAYVIRWFIVPACDPCLAADMPRPDDGSVDHMVNIISPPIGGDGVYHAYRTYSHQVSLVPGDYMLYHGSKVNTQELVERWRGGGWIDMVGVLDRIYVEFDDNRASTRQPGCYQGADNMPIIDITCPIGQSFWSMTPFSIGFGNGGALAVAGTSGVTIQNVTFASNSAGNGPSAYGVAVTSMDLVSTTLDDVAEPLQLFAVQLETCETRPCSAGSRCSMLKSSRFCHDCGINEIGDGRVCTACPPGTGPNADHSVCLECATGKYSGLGLCNQCGAGSHASETGQAVCQPCPDKTRPNIDSTGCLCAMGSYNETAGVHVCFSRGFDEEYFNDAVTSHESSARSSALDCAGCPQDQGGDECLRCTGGQTMIAPGYTIPVLPEGSEMTTDFSSEIMLVFRCHHKMEVAEKRCPGTPLNETAGLTHHRVTTSGCAPGFEGYICGECAPDFGMSTSQECEPCGDTGFTWKSVGVLAGTLGGALVGFAILSLFWRQFSLKHVIRCAFQPMRILITYSQVTSQLGDVLDFQYPGLFGDIIAFLKPVMDVWGLFFRALGPSECFGLQGFQTRWLLRVVGLPLVMAAFVVVIWVIQLCTVGRQKAAIGLKGNMFFCVFFTYPTICIVSFASFICRPLTSTLSVLEVDDSTSCEDPSHVALQWVSIGVIAVISVGLPIGLFIILWLKAKDWEKNKRGRYADVAQRMSAELGCDLKQAEFVIRDIVVGQDFSFVMDAFDPRYLYWEAFDMIRKLALVGLVLLAGRGSVAQLASAITLSFCFFALHMKAWPYKIESDNIFRAATELHVFIVITTALVLKSDLAVEKVTEDAYDFVLFFSFIALVPVAFVVVVVIKVRTMAAAVAGGMSMAEVEPAEMRRRAFELHVIGLGSDVDKENLRRFIDGWAVSKEFAGFLSHYKKEAAAEARILKTELVRALRTSSNKVFLDADNLTDLRVLLNNVKQSDIFILMLTDGVLSRPWCLAELNAAAEADIPILVLSINNSYRCNASRITEILTDLPAYLKHANPTAIKELSGSDCMLDVEIIGPRILDAIKKANTNIAFDPNQSSVMLQSQIAALAKEMIVACPENEALLPDLNPKEREPWIAARPVAMYIVYSEESDVIARQAAAMKDWLCMHCDINEEQIALCSNPDEERPVDEAVVADCADISANVDTVILLQSAGVLSEPRCLARLYVASKVRTPIVPVHLTSTDPQNKLLLWDFDTAKTTMLKLGTNLNARTAAMVKDGTGGASAAQVGAALARVVPNIISKPLEIDGSATQFEAQMLDIELTLRREMPVDGDEIIRKQPTLHRAISWDSQPVDPLASTRRGSKHNVKVKVAEGVPQPVRENTPPRQRAKAVVAVPASPTRARVRAVAKLKKGQTLTPEQREAAARRRLASRRGAITPDAQREQAALLSDL